ncbi:MAG: NYN domain-containing protein [Roseburia sp.]|nr:NYN domain-containing protein [Roseburia sp.]MCM1279228.1 NYN domain-containing protein [Robinsoniella sp.]
MEEKRFALLIDSDNISAKYVKNILDELTKYGVVTNKRIYGDWTKTETSSWKDVLLKHSIQPMQQFAYTKGKNATDSFMIIDAMDILYSNTVEGFCLVTSDSDFTRLAARLREAGKMVVGMGESKTPEAFISACDKFTYLGNISGEDELGGSSKKEKKHTRKVGEIENAILTILDEKESIDGKTKTDIGEVGSRLVKMYPDFDVRNYGYTKFSTFCEGLKSLKLYKTDKSILISAVNKDEEEVLKLLREIVSQAGTNGIDLGTLGQKLKEADPTFTVKKYGFSQFKKFIKSIPFLQITVDDKKNSNMVILK